MSNPLVRNKLWAIMAPLLPPEPPKSKGGRPRCISDRAALTRQLVLLGTLTGFSLPRYLNSFVVLDVHEVRDNPDEFALLGL